MMDNIIVAYIIMLLFQALCPANTTHRPDVGPMARRLRRRPNIGPASGRCAVFAGWYPDVFVCVSRYWVLI